MWTVYSVLLIAIFTPPEGSLQELTNIIKYSLIDQEIKINTWTRKTSTQSEDSQCYNKPVPQRTICPEGFTEYIHSRCIWMQGNQSFPPTCPYPHYHSYGYIKAIILDLFPDTTIWLNVFRNTSSGFPEFEWMDNGLYGRSFTEDIINLNGARGKNCIVVQNGRFYRVDCSERHTTFCVYSHSLFLASRGAEKCNVEGYQYCMLANYDFRYQKCFCERFQTLLLKKNEFCKKLIEPLSFQSELLARQYQQRHHMYYKCWMGLYKERFSNNIYKWFSTKEIVNYTRWVNPNSCKYLEGAYQFHHQYSQNGWLLLEDKTLNCALCELSVSYEMPNLQLKHIRSINSIQLLISNPNSISELGLTITNKLDVYCYSDRPQRDFKEYIPVTILTSDLNNETFNVIHNIPLAENQPSHYWCVAFQYPSFNPVVSNTIVAFKKEDNYGYEFSVEVIFKVDPNYDPVFNKIYLNVCDYIREEIIEKWNHLLFLRPMRGYLNGVDSMKLIIHLTTKSTNQSATEQQVKLTKVIEGIQTTEMKLSNVYSSEVCLFSTTLTIDGEILEWPETKIGVTTIPANILCLDRNNKMLPVTRDCVGDFLIGGRWSRPKGNCYAKENHSEMTKILFNLTKSDASAEEVINTLDEITKVPIGIKVVDVHLIATLLEKLETLQQNFSSDYYVEIVSNIMNFDRIALKDAQLLLNSTDKILSSLDNILNSEGVISLSSLRLLVEIVEIEDENIIGIAFFQHNLKYYNTMLFQNTSLHDLMNDSTFEIAVILPSFEKEGINVTDTPIKLITTVFLNDFLFNSHNNNITDNKIVGVTVSHLYGFLKTPLKVLFRKSSSNETLKYCCHWNYGIDDLMISKQGYWEKSVLSKTNGSYTEECEYLHMTHFGLLLKDNAQEDSNDDILTLLTTIGSALSLIGIIPIFITAILFKQWRSRIGNIILLNLAAAITLQIILTFCLHAVKQDGIICKAIGALLHYSILTEFCWMLVVAILEYRRFVIVFSKPESDLLKFLFVGWGIPLLPVVITLSISPDNYKMNNHTFCYVSGNYFIYGLILPILLILLNNLVVFVGIFYSISQTSFVNIKNNHNNYKLEICLSVLLFFTLGLSWLFGIIGAWGGGIWFTYLFCITGTIRGFVLFSFFIVGNKETRSMWRRRVRNYIDTNASRTS